MSVNNHTHTKNFKAQLILVHLGLVNKLTLKGIVLICKIKYTEGVYISVFNGAIQHMWL